MISTRDLEWAAGFIEGEGSFFAGTKGIRISISATQVQKWPLERLELLFGGKFHYRKPGTTYRRNAQGAWFWILTGSRAAGVIMTLYSLLSPKRKEQARAALQTWKSTPARPRKNPFDKVAA